MFLDPHLAHISLIEFYTLPKLKRFFHKKNQQPTKPTKDKQ